MKKITEESSHYQDLEKMSVTALLENMNKEDQSVPLAVKKSIPQIEPLIKEVVEKIGEKIISFKKYNGNFFSCTF